MPTVSGLLEGDSEPIRWVATWPVVMTTSGMEVHLRASTMPVMALVAQPGPEVTRTTPGLPVERA